MTYIYLGLMTDTTRPSTETFTETKRDYSPEFSHEGVVGHAGPGHVAEGPAGQSFGSREVAEREGQNHGQTPDTDDDSCGSFRRQTRLQGMDDGHVPAGQRSAG